MATRRKFYPDEPSIGRQVLGFLGGAAQGVGTALAQKQWDDRLKRRDLMSDIDAFNQEARDRQWTPAEMEAARALRAKAGGWDLDEFSVSPRTTAEMSAAARAIAGSEHWPVTDLARAIGAPGGPEMMVARGTIESGPPQMGLTGPLLAAAPTPPPDMTRPLPKRNIPLSPEQMDTLLGHDIYGVPKKGGRDIYGVPRSDAEGEDEIFQPDVSQIVAESPWSPDESVTVRAPQPSPFAVEGDAMYSKDLDFLVRQQEAQREARERTGEITREETAEAQRATAITANEMANLFSSEETQRQMQAVIQMANNPEYDDAMREQFLRNSAVQLAAKVAELTEINAPEGVIQQQIRKNEVLSAAMRAAFGLSHTPVRVTFPDQTSGFVFFGFDENGNITVTRAPGGAEPWSSTQGGLDWRSIPGVSELMPPGDSDLTQADMNRMGYIISNYYR